MREKQPRNVHFLESPSLPCVLGSSRPGATLITQPGCLPSDPGGQMEPKSGASGRMGAEGSPGPMTSPLPPATAQVEIKKLSAAPLPGIKTTLRPAAVLGRWQTHGGSRSHRREGRGQPRALGLDGDAKPQRCPVSSAPG